MTDNLTSFHEILSQAKPHGELDWTLSNTLTALGFGVSDAALRMQKQRRNDELVEGKHWIKNGRSLEWSRRGIVRLGFALEGERPKLFRDACENYLIEGLATTTTTTVEPIALEPIVTTDQTLTLDDLAADLAMDYLESLPQKIEKHLRQIAESPTPEQARRLDRAFTRAYPSLRVAILAAVSSLKRTEK